MAAGDEGMNWLREFFKSRYVSKIEADLASALELEAALRVENRALVNSLLGTAGVAPIELPEKVHKINAPVRRPTWFQISRRKEFEAGRALREKTQEEANASR
jgi:hypothetical protein